MKRTFLKKQVFVICFLFFSCAIYSQTFTELSGISLPAVSYGSTEWGDYDNDGDLDLLISGGNDVNASVLKIYRNDGSDSFEDIGDVFTPDIPSLGIWSGEVLKASWSDINLDGFIDLVIVGPSSFGDYQLMVYRNDGGSSFSLQYQIHFLTFQGGSSFDCGDYDNDGDPDIVVTGSIYTRILRNMGGFVFTELSSPRLVGIRYSSAKWIDYDNDGDLDVLVTGQPTNDYNSAFLYRNEGNDIFILQTDANLYTNSNSTGDWGDFNNDGFADAALVGGNNIYKNNGDNTFEQQSYISFPFTSNGTRNWGDIDNDGDLDLLITGNANSTDISKVYLNNGDNTFAEATGIILTGVSEGSVDMGDYDNDGDLDIVLSGKTGPSKTCKIYKNDSATGNTVPVAPTGLVPVSTGEDMVLTWDPVTSDGTDSKSLTYNVMVGTGSGGTDLVNPASSADGWRKVAAMGNGQMDTTFVLKNIKPGTYYWKVQAVDNCFAGGAFSTESEFTYTSFCQSYGLYVKNTGSTNATFTWSRGNGDNCIVFVKKGNDGTANPEDNTSYSASTIFGSGSEIGSTGWFCVYNGDQSIVNIVNLEPLTEYIVQVYEYVIEGGNDLYYNQINDQNSKVFSTGIFTEMTGAIPVAPNSTNGLVVDNNGFWFDLDNDDDLDLFLQKNYEWDLYLNSGDNTFTKLPATFDYGQTATCSDYNNDGYIDITILTSSGTFIYKNNGNNTFTKLAGTSIIGTMYGSINWGDYDNDGDLDLLLTGEYGGSFECKAEIYRNNGDETFTQMTNHNLTGMRYGSADWGDYNNDGYLDIVLSGINVDGIYTTRVFRNEKNGSFTNIGDIFNKIGKVKWGDYDNDGDLDILISASNPNLVFRNDGNDIFTRQDQISIGSIPFGYGDGSWGDYNNDGYLDIAITGYTGFYLPFSKVYRNNTDNTFQEDTDCALTQAGSSVPVWGDFDNDNDLDLLLLGVSSDSVFVKLYRNDIGTANTIPEVPTGLVSTVNKSEVELRWNSVRTDNTDYRGLTYNLIIGTSPDGFDLVSPHSSADGYRRVVSMGNAGQDTVAVYKNLAFGDYYWRVQAVDNSFAGGPFSDQNMFSIEPVQATNITARIINNNSLLLKWERGNGARCLVFCNETATGSAVPVDNKSYIPDSEFGYGEQLGSTGWYCVYNGRGDSVAVTGLKYKTDYSFHIIEYLGEIGSEQYFTELVNGNPGVFSTGLFSEQTNISLSQSWFNIYSWGDYNNDGLSDLLIPGRPTKLYENNSDNSFSEVSTGLPDVTYGDAEWGDYDNDGDLDIAITGGIYGSMLPAISRIYRNDGSGIFTEQTQISLDSVYYSALDWGDYDNDGDLDLVLTGATGTDPYFNPVSKIFRNNGDNTFTEQSQIILTGVYRGDVKWVDYDNDGDLDLHLAGSLDYNYGNCISVIYRNNGDNTFTEQTQYNLPGLWEPAIDWGDYDNDGDMDIVMTRPGTLYAYRNDGESFTNVLTKGYGYSSFGTVCWGDYDNDGFLDILFSNFAAAAIIFRNDHGNGFYKLDDDSFVFTQVDGMKWCDYDNDGDIDIVYNRWGDVCTLFKNNLYMRSGYIQPNKQADSPARLSADYSPEGIILHWHPVMNDETKPQTLSYNIKIGTSIDSEDIYSCQADTSGFRKVVKLGNVQLDTTHLINNLETGKYYWRVQAVDQGFIGGRWSAVDSFEVRNVQTFFDADEVCLGYSTTFTDQSVATGGIATWYWDFKDGTFSADQSPVHTYSASGTYNVKLVITDNGGIKDSLEQDIIVRSKPLTSFSAPDVCQGIPVTAINTTSNNGLTISTWDWDFGDGSTSTDDQPGPHGYLTAGDYTIRLKAIAINGCADSVSSVVSVGSYPVAAVTANAPLTFCKGDSVTLSVPYNSTYVYDWMAGGTSLTGGDSSSYTAKLTGSYTVKVINPKGNCTTTSGNVPITAHEAPAAPLITASMGLEFCDGDSVILSVSHTLNYVYQWKLNGGAVGIDTSQFTAKSGGTYNVTVTNSTRCSVVSANSVVVTVKPKPSAGNISLNGPAVFCRGGSVTLSIPLTVGYTYNWKNDYGLITGAEANSYVADTTGIYKLEVTNTSGCKAETSPVTITVRPSPEKPVIEKSNYTPGVCSGDEPIRLSMSNSSSGYIYQWIKDGVEQAGDTLSYIEFYEQGIYKLRVSVGDCESESDTIPIELPESPTKPTVYVRGPTVWYLACSNTTANEYRWYCNGELIEGAKSYFYVAGNKVGLYQVSISNEQECFTRSDVYSVPTGYTATEDIDLFVGLSIYPNPTTGLFTIEIDNNIFGDISIDIITEQGKVIRNIRSEKRTEHYLTEIDLSSQSKGFYFVNLRIDKYLVTRKVIIE
jgi:hypothetical protein